MSTPVSSPPRRIMRPSPRLRPPRAARLLVALGLWAAAAGCERRARPWDGPLDAAVVDESEPWLLRSPDASWLGARAPGHGADAGDAGPGAVPSPVGGLWVSCYGGFHPSGHPLKDVTRLGMLCGPANGMKLRSTGQLQGEVSAEAPPSTHRFAARRGECYRLFAVAGPTVADLDVSVRSSRGSRLATDHSEDAWPILHPERPFCTFGDDTFTVEVSARRGAGRYALQIWHLPARE